MIQNRYISTLLPLSKKELLSPNTKIFLFEDEVINAIDTKWNQDCT